MYKVPQDVEADDKLLGPLSFRQFIYMMIVLGMVALAVAFYQLFPLLAIIPIPIAFFFLVLALPIKKDQPMETYLAAILSFYLKPNRRFWMPGQSESTIKIDVPKKVEAPRTRSITEEEASHRLSFLAELVDTEGQSIKNSSNPMRDELYAEAYNTTDMFDNTNSFRINTMISEEEEKVHAQAVEQMRIAISQSAYNHDRPQTFVPIANQHQIQPITLTTQPTAPTPYISDPSNTIVQPNIPVNTPAIAEQMKNLANDPTLSIETIEEESDRINKENQSEVYVSLR